MITKAQIDRETADYNIYKVISKGVAERRVKEAEQFFNEIIRRLNEPNEQNGPNYPIN